MLRREFIIGGFGAALAMGNIDPLLQRVARAADNIPENPLSFIDVNKEDQKFKAATVKLVSRNKLYKYSGMGGVVEYQKQLGILTVHHVIRDGDQLAITIPGVLDSVLSTEYVKRYKQAEGTEDATIFIPLPQKPAQLLEEARRANVISPLSIAESGAQVGEHVALPSNSAEGYDIFGVRYVFDKLKLLMVTSPTPTLAHICAGRSGAPLLRVEGSGTNIEITNQVVGVVKGYTTRSKISEEPRCGTEVTATDISPFTTQ